MSTQHRKHYVPRQKLFTEQGLLNSLGYNDNRPAVLPASRTWLRRINPELSDRQARTEAERIEKNILDGILTDYVACRVLPAKVTRWFWCAFDTKQGSVDDLARGIFGDECKISGTI